MSAPPPSMAPPPANGPVAAAAPGASQRRGPLVLIAALVVLLLIVGVAAVVLLTGGGTASAADVRLDPATEPGPDPYTPPVVAATPSTTTSSGSSLPSTTTQLSVAPPAAGAVRSYVGSQPGLYGGTRDVHTCDPERMISFLTANPDKERAWADVEGIQASDVPSYVRSLTAVTLRTDTVVTNHGYRDGGATTISSVLEAGTAVLVDHYGTPRAKCYCGNPLTPVTHYRAHPRYVGPAWPTWNPQLVVIVQQSTTIIQNLVLVDPYGRSFVRPFGTDGSKDTDQPASPGPSSNNPTTTQAATTTSTPAPTTTTSTSGPFSAAALSGSWTFSVTMDGATACTGYSGHFDLTVTDGPPRSLSLQLLGTQSTGATITGSLDPDNSFTLDHSLGGGGTELIQGAITRSGSTYAMDGTDTLKIPTGSCKGTLHATRDQ